MVNPLALSHWDDGSNGLLVISEIFPESQLLMLVATEAPQGRQELGLAARLLGCTWTRAKRSGNHGYPWSSSSHHQEMWVSMAIPSKHWVPT
jgi:hypothetical protein